MNDRDSKDLAVFRHFVNNARGHVDDRSDRPTARDMSIYEAESLRERLILKLGIFSDDTIVYEHAKERFAQRGASLSGNTFDELEPGIRGSWIRSSKLAIATFSDDSYRRLADTTAKEIIKVGLDGIQTEHIRDGW